MISPAQVDELRALIAAATGGEWFIGPTPRYLGSDQFADGGSRREDPVTIRSPEHSEEIATTWTYLLPAKANAELIVAAVNALPSLLAALERAGRIEEAAKPAAEALRMLAGTYSGRMLDAARAMSICAKLDAALAAEGAR